jgi:hypothetical protein
MDTDALRGAKHHHERRIAGDRPGLPARVAARIALTSIVLVPWVPTPGLAQKPAPVVSHGAVTARPRIFLDCDAPGCDFDFFRTEITFVDWVRDPDDADVHILVTSEPTGGGGRLYHVSFGGRHTFEALDFEHDFATREWYSVDEERSALSRRLQAGLLPYLGGTDTFDWIEVRFTSPESLSMGEGPTQPTADPWKSWVLSLGVDGSYGGESRRRALSYSGSFAANRTTATSRVNLAARWSRTEEEFDFDDETYVSNVENYSATLSMVRSLSPHWGMGIRPELWSSTFQNTDLGLRVPVALEVSLFPYAEFTRRALLLHYSVGWNALDYFEETLFDKTKEEVWDHRAGVSLQFVQEWGTADLELGGSQYLHDHSKYSLSASGTLSMRLFRGLSLDLFGSYESIRDQLNIPKGGASDEEVLLRLKALETSYYAFATVGFSYRFGSIFNNAVNPTISWFR